MASPIGWALGVFTSFALVATFAGDRLARSTARGEADAPAAAAVEARREPARLAGTTGRTVSISPDRLGHYVTGVAVDGRRVTMLVDTGASLVALTHEDAAAAGVRPYPSDYTRAIGTANGTVAVAPVRLREVRVGEITVRDVEAVVVPAGRLGTSLLGMSFLRQLRAFDVADGRLTLRD